MSDAKTPSASVLPLHALPSGNLPGVNIRRRPGRPRRVALAPDVDQRAYLDRVREEQALALEADPVVVESADVRGSVMSAAIVALAEETAALRWQREREQAEGKDAAATSGRRVDALGKLANIVQAAHAMGLWGVGPSPSTLRLVVRAWLDVVEAVARDTLAPEVADRFCGEYRAKIVAVDVAALVESSPS